jgi:hypothetical protein
MTSGTIAMKCLLIGEGDHRRTGFMFDLGHRRHKLRRFAGPGVTISAGRDPGRGRSLVEKICR